MLNENPLLALAEPLPFDRVQAFHVQPAVTQLVADARAALGVIEQSDGPRTYANTLDALERATDSLERAMGVTAHLESVATTPELRDAYNAVQPIVSEFYSGIPLSAPLYAALKAFAHTDEAKTLDATRRRFLDKTLDSFRREGAELDDAGKQRLTAINVELAQLTTRYGQHVLDATNAFELILTDRARLSGLPQRVIEAAEQSAKSKGVEGFRFTLQAPSFMPVMTYADDRDLRRQLYEAYYSRASSGAFDNREHVTRILSLRHEKAILLGFKDFADLVLVDRMAKQGANAKAFLDDLHARSVEAFHQENKDLRAFAASLGGPAELAPWDVGYYAEKQRVALYDFDEELLRPYFQLDSVLDGLFQLVHRIYGVTIEPVGGLPVWHESVQTFRVVDENGAELGAFYADLFPREEKRDGAWMNHFLTAERTDNGWTRHVGGIFGNLTPAVGGTPSLLGHREVETVFHELGHLLHHLLSRVEVRSLAGTNVAWDFVELPSQIMENFCWEREALDLFARHHKTGEVIPDELFQKMQRAKTFRGANVMMRQLGLATLDLRLHMEPGLGGMELLAFAQAAVQSFTATVLPKGYAMVTGFGHLFSHPVGYASGYYSYKWAEVLDADAFGRFKQAGVFSREVGQAFRDAILAKGDSRDPAQLFRDFMGRDPDLGALLARSGIAA